MATLKEEELRTIARLSFMQLDEEEIRIFCLYISKVLEHMGELQQVQFTAGHETVRMINVFREDKAVPTDSAPLLAQAPQVEGTHFVVPKVLD